MLRLAVLALFSIVSACVLSVYPTTQADVPTALPEGLYWSQPIAAPTQPLLAGARQSVSGLAPGLHDFACVPIGDNWALPEVGPVATVTLDRVSNVSVMPRFPFNEPSSGFLILHRGPYLAGAEDRGPWDVCSLPSGQGFRLFPMPAYTHVGGRYDRYGSNGYPYIPGGGYPGPGSWYWGTNSQGPSRFAGGRQPVVSAELPPDVTVTSSTPNKTVYVAYSLVDCFGRETALSPVCEVGGTFWFVSEEHGTIINLCRNVPLPMGTAGIYLYAGLTAETLTRQPILNYEGSAAKYLWPKWLACYPVHRVIDTGIINNPAANVASVFNEIQHKIEAGEKYITFDKPSYDLYCTLDLPYADDPVEENKPRTVGDGFRRTKFIPKNTLGGCPIITDCPMVHCENFGDRLQGASFDSPWHSAGITFTDCVNGGRAMSTTLNHCSFVLRAADTYGLLVDERCSIAVGLHTCSELEVIGCEFTATNPVKLEGNQTAKVRFSNGCSFSGNGVTRYQADTTGLIYQCASPDVQFNGVKGVNGAFRTLIGMRGVSGSTSVQLRDFYVDAGCNVVATIAGYDGASLVIKDGGAINQGARPWQRLVEAPIARNVRANVGGFYISGATSSVSFMLNQLAIVTDFPVAEVVTPTEFSWIAKTMPLVNEQGFDYTVKPKFSRSIGMSDVVDTLPRKTSAEVP